MGKKTKRITRRAAKEKNERERLHVVERQKELRNNYYNSVERCLYSKSVEEVEESLRFLKSKENLFMGASNDSRSQFEFLLFLEYSNLMLFEYQKRYNFCRVVEIFNDLFKSKDGARLLSRRDQYEYMKSLRDLALIETESSQCECVNITQFLLRELQQDESQRVLSNPEELYKEVQGAFCAAKKYEVAIDLHKKILALPNVKNPFDTNILLVTTYIERYRVKHDQRSKREDYLLIRDLLQYIRSAYPVPYFNREYSVNDFGLALAQWNYVCQKLGGDQASSHEYKQAIIFHVEQFIAKMWKMKDFCSTCYQAHTKCEVPFVCSSCHVVCYCSLDHQRKSWKKGAARGMCIGHKALCPVFKAYRKWKVSLGNDCNHEQQRMRMRFERQCVHFLAYGLGLKEKCFDPKDVFDGGSRK